MHLTKFANRSPLCLCSQVENSKQKNHPWTKEKKQRSPEKNERTHFCVGKKTKTPFWEPQRQSAWALLSFWSVHLLALLALPQVVLFPFATLYFPHFSVLIGRQHGRVVRASDLKTVMLRVQIPFRPPADVVLSSPQFNFSAMLINSQLVCLPPVEILNLIMFISILIYHCWFALVLKIPNGEWPIMYTFSFYIFTFYLQYKSGCNAFPG